MKPIAHSTDILTFWFSEKALPFHFKKDKKFDDEIRQNFLTTYQDARHNKLDDWQAAPDSSLALIILLDQFPRNMFRQLPDSFATDEQALRVAQNALRKNFDKHLTQDQCAFLYMPFMHSENHAMQDMSVKLYQTLDQKHGAKDNLKFAIAHRDIMTRFGRFPHRNVILGRASTAEELEFLKQPYASF